MSDTDPTCKLLETSVLLLNGKQLSGTKIIASLSFPTVSGFKDWNRCSMSCLLETIFFLFSQPFRTFYSMSSHTVKVTRSHRWNSRVHMQEFPSGRASTSTHLKRRLDKRGEKKHLLIGVKVSVCVYGHALSSPFPAIKWFMAGKDEQHDVWRLWAQSRRCAGLLSFLLLSFNQTLGPRVSICMQNMESGKSG